MSVSLTHPVREAAKMGTEDGRASGSWYPISDTRGARRIIEMLNDCDPSIMDDIPNPLSGEWADGYTIGQLAKDTNSDMLPWSDYFFDSVVPAYENSFSDGWIAEVTRRAHNWLGQ